MQMKQDQDKPECFGILDIVFPMHDDGLRHSPETCILCRFKTECLRSAIKNPEGMNVHEEMVDRAYGAGKINFLQRWSRRKHIHNVKRKKKE